MITRNVYQSFIERYMCDECGTEVRCTYQVTTRDCGDVYQHRCNNCGYTVYLDYIYPVLYEREEAPDRTISERRVSMRSRHT